MYLYTNKQNKMIITKEDLDALLNKFIEKEDPSFKEELAFVDGMNAAFELMDKKLKK